jgi:hypothetical protein
VVHTSPRLTWTENPSRTTKWVESPSGFDEPEPDVPVPTLA